MKQALLVAGPLTLDDIGEHRDLIGGGGGHAAIAAAAFAPTQLWARGGTAFDLRLRQYLEQRRIDLAGVSWEGETPRFRQGRFEAGGPLLGDLEPTSAENVGAVLLIGLDGTELERAIRAVQALPKAATRPLLIVPHRSAGVETVERSAQVADVLVLQGDQAPLARSGALQALGAKCVCWCRGPYGGLVVYQQKATTWPALPVEVVEPTGVTASFAGALAAHCALAGKADFSAIKRGLAVASAVASLTAQGPGSKKLLSCDRSTFEDRFNRLRRTHKF